MSRSRPIVYAFLGFCGKRYQRYPGMTELIQKIEAVGIPVRPFEWQGRRRAQGINILYDSEDALTVLAHSRGCETGLEFIKRREKPVEYFFPIDYIPHDPLENIAAFYRRIRGRENPAVVAPRNKIKQLMAFRQNLIRWTDVRTWPQGRFFVDEEGIPWSRQYKIRAYHTEIDGTEAVHRKILASLLNRTL